MLLFLPPWMLGVVSFVVFGLNTVFWCTLVFVAAAIKLVVPMPAWRAFWSRVLVWMAERWVDGNAALLRVAHRVEWDVRGLETLRRDEWYLVGCNHQSWVDIPVLQTVLKGRIPFIKFFLKREMIRVPLLGLAWWALDFPFMQRYSREFLEKHPECRGKDLETTRKACEKFRFAPLTILNFLEGTRFSAAKHERQDSPYRNLLRPKAGGIAFTLESLDNVIQIMLDVTVVYPDGVPSFGDLLCGRMRRVIVEVRPIDLPPEVLGGSYESDAVFRAGFQEWVGRLWESKDERIDVLLAAASADTTG